MIDETFSPQERFLTTLAIVYREGQHLGFSWHRLFDQTIDAAWVAALDRDPERAERLEAFVSRFGRMQDTIATKLLPRWLVALAEEPGSQIETLNRAERLGVLESADRWLEARQLRNRLIHEYMESPSDFAANLQLARELSLLVMATYNRIREDAETRLGIPSADLPERLSLP
jgi:hypothetical protein